MARYAIVTKRWRKLSPRTRLVVSFTIAEVLVLVGIFLQLWSLRGSIAILLEDSAERQLNLVEMAYNKKSSEMQLICKSDTQMSRVVKLLKGDHTMSDGVHKLLRDEAVNNKLVGGNCHVSTSQVTRVMTHFSIPTGIYDFGG